MLAFVVVTNVLRGGQAVCCECGRLRGRHSVGKLRSRPRLRPPRCATDHPLHARTARLNFGPHGGAPSDARQHLDVGRDIPQEWWTLFQSPALDTLMERSLQNNPTLQSALATLRAANQAVYAQEGKYFPLAQANFNPTRQQTSAAIAPVPSSGASVFNLDTAQVLVSYTSMSGVSTGAPSNSLEAIADTQHFQVEAAYLTLTANIAVAAITEASLRAQIDATNEIIATNSRMLGTLRTQSNAGYANRNDVALQEAALAQAKATLPPLQKALETATRSAGGTLRRLPEPGTAPRYSDSRTCICRPIYRSACRHN